MNDDVLDLFSDDETGELELHHDGLERPPDVMLAEAVLFASTEVVTIKVLREIFGQDLSQERAQNLMTRVDVRLREGGHPFEVVPLAGGWRMRTLPALHPFLRGLMREQQARRLSAAVLETLAVIAYKQPITKAEIEAVRGVSADGALRRLLERKLVAVVGRQDQPGRPLAYGTTSEFNEYFGITRIPQDLPRLAEFEDLVRARALLPQIAPGGRLLVAEQPEEEGGP